MEILSPIFYHYGKVSYNGAIFSTENLQECCRCKQFLCMGKISRKLEQVESSFFDSSTVSNEFLKMEI